MKALIVPLEIPIDQLLEVVGPKLLRTIRAAEKEERAALNRRPCDETLVNAAMLHWKALDRYEASKGTRDEKRALNALLATSQGVRSAAKNLHKKD
ncbi:hypothetical protein FS815_24550 [Agrobacterium vitis]|uniref:hypothetical protein n=1 Tax=Allorhizobium ampelinum TaxID=3025782 RepID=UPI001F2B67B5|nr:hypothetical protein [Allorhizobium ampelinum]MCF1449964.1 hypothetical protein [Allorhizobium ampelinum]